MQVRAEGGRGQHVATYQICRDDGLLIAAAPDLLNLLEGACHGLEKAGRSELADTIRKTVSQLLRDQEV